MSKIYKIRDGFSFVDSDNSVKTGGDTIELADDVAELHKHKLEPLKPEKAPKKQAPSGDDNTGGADLAPSGDDNTGGADLAPSGDGNTGSADPQ